MCTTSTKHEKFMLEDKKLRILSCKVLFVANAQCNIYYH